MKNVAIGISDFKKILDDDIFYVDKTYFIKEWLDNKDAITLITRPRCFGKTLTLSMMEYFLSDKHKDNKYLFNNLYIGNCDNSNKYMRYQGSAPVIFLTFSGIKGNSFGKTYEIIGEFIANLYSKYEYLLNKNILNSKEIRDFNAILNNVASSTVLELSLFRLCEYIYRDTGKKTYILLDEYDTPMQNAYINNYWDDFTSFIMSFFVNTLKNNIYLERAIITGITRIAKESIFSGLNNLTVVTTTSKKYASCFGFTEDETFKSLDSYGLSEQKEKVKQYYNGFIIGGLNIYNPWSILHFLNEKEYDTYWVNTSSNNIINDVVASSSSDVKINMEALLKGDVIYTSIIEDIVFKDLDNAPDTAIWGLLLAAGYVKVVDYSCDKMIYGLQLTNLEVQKMFEKLFKQWFSKSIINYNNFINTMLDGNAKGMEYFLNTLSLDMFSYFDTNSSKVSRIQPEKFYHGFVLGLMVDMKDRFVIDSNRESGLGRYDVCVIPKNIDKDVAVIIEFKAFYEYEGKSLDEVADSALEQIQEKKYEQKLVTLGVKKIFKYGIAFKGKECRVKMAE